MKRLALICWIALASTTAVSTPLAQVDSVAGEAFVRRAFAYSWDRVVYKDNLYEGDLLQTLENSEIVLKLSSKSSSRVFKVSTPVVLRIDNDLFRQFAENEIRLDNIPEIENPSDTESPTYLLENAWQRIRVSLRAWNSGDRLRDLGKKNIGVSSDIALSSTKPAITWLAPHRRATYLTPNGRANVRLAWRPLAGITNYEVQRAVGDEDWKTIAISNSLQYNIELIGTNTHWLRIKAVGSEDISSMRAVRLVGARDSSKPSELKTESLVELTTPPPGFIWFTPTPVAKTVDVDFNWTLNRLSDIKKLKIHIRSLQGKE